MNVILFCANRTAFPLAANNPIRITRLSSKEANHPHLIHFAAPSGIQSSNLKSLAIIPEILVPLNEAAIKPLIVNSAYYK